MRAAVVAMVTNDPIFYLKSAGQSSLVKSGSYIEDVLSRVVV